LRKNNEFYVALKSLEKVYSKSLPKIFRGDKNSKFLTFADSASKIKSLGQLGTFLKLKTAKNAQTKTKITFSKYG
jgi:hypothetical protein